MKNFFLLTLLFITCVRLAGQDTFSIVAVDTVTSEVGSAGASCIGYPDIPIGCKIISDVHPGVGAIHTQALYDYQNQAYGQSLMDQGFSPQQIIDSLVANDAQNTPLVRQYGVVDFTGSAGYTGVGCFYYRNHISGGTYCIQGNILLGQQILDSMEWRFLNTPGNLACKLMAALQGAKVPGADTRCLLDSISSLSSFLRIAKPTDLPTSLSVDLNVRSALPGVDPIDSLQTLFDASGACNSTSVNPVIKENHAIQVFPNPAGNFVLVISTKPVEEVLLVDFDSKSIWKKNEGQTQFTIKLKTEELASGIHLLQFKFSDGTHESMKLVTP